MKNLKIIVLDVETTGHKRENGDLDLTPYHPNNKLVSVGWAKIIDGQLQPTQYGFIQHKELEGTTFFEGCDALNSIEEFKKDLAWAEIVVAHNAKFDLAWLAEAEYKTDHLVIHDTMIIEYVLNRGMKRELNLRALCEKYQVSAKLGSPLEKYPELDMYSIPLKEVEEYGRADVKSCGELYLAICERCKENNYEGLYKTIQLSNEFCKVLIDIERQGIGIDINALNEVEKEFTTEYNDIKEYLYLKAKEVMGDTNVNFESPEQLSEVLYSRRVKPDKFDEWARAFNIGVDERGKSLRRPRMSFKDFKQHIVNLTETVYRTKAAQCKDCEGKGYIRKTKKDGSPFKKTTKCNTCDNHGVIFHPTDIICGFKLQPQDNEYPSSNGFSTDKTTLYELLSQAQSKGNTEAEEFIRKCIRLGALGSYLSMYVKGVKAAVINNVLHPNFNQCITRTGRLSCTRPNLQNQPREKTFPFRKVFISKFKGGCITDVDFSQLEFRTAVSLAKDENGKKDILDGKDIHIQTRDVISDAGQIIDRQAAKSHTFKPLYGGKTGTKAEKTYYETFLSGLYPNIGTWHKQLQEEAISTKLVTIPSGRQYLFPNVKREWHGGSSHYTMIVNYPVQGFATADIVPLGIMKLHYALRSANLHSHIVLTVHDDVVVDTHPDEVDQVVKLCKNLAQFAEEELKLRYDYEMFVPLACECKTGPNLLELKVA